MLVLYAGGSASGKSEAAEAAAAAAAREAKRPLIYLATMERGGREAAARRWASGSVRESRNPP